MSEKKGVQKRGQKQVRKRGQKQDQKKGSVKRFHKTSGEMVMSQVFSRLPNIPSAFVSRGSVNMQSDMCRKRPLTSHELSLQKKKTRIRAHMCVFELRFLAFFLIINKIKRENKIKHDSQ